MWVWERFDWSKWFRLLVFFIISNHVSNYYCYFGRCGKQTPMRPPQKRAAAQNAARKILRERNSSTASSINPDESFLSHVNMSLASTGSYTDFQVSYFYMKIGFVIFYIHISIHSCFTAWDNARVGMSEECKEQFYTKEFFNGEHCIVSLWYIEYV